MRLPFLKRRREDDTASSGANKSEHQSVIANTLNTSSNIELVPIANVISETIQSLKAKRRALDFAIDEDHEETQFVEVGAAAEFEEDEEREESGHFFTAAEVAQALKRDYRELGAKEEEKGANGRDGESMKRVGIFGCNSMPHKWSLSNYLQSVASTREKRIVAVSAWLLALAGLIVALSFVTKDFLESRDELASTVHYVHEDRMELPSLWFCSMGTMMSPFADFPNEEFKGQPLVWIDRIHGLEEDETRMSFPETQKLRQLEVMSVDMMGKKCEALTKMDPMVFYQENMKMSSCFYCLTISRNPAIELGASRTRAGSGKQSRQGGGAEQGGHVGFRVSKHSFIKNCRMRSMGLSRNGLAFFRNEVKKYRGELQERGILDVGGFDMDGDLADGYLWPDYRFGYRNVTVDWGVLDVADMFCNVYLFSGFFYPSSARDVRYRFDNRLLLWERVGAGPYYPSNFSAQGRRKTGTTALTTDKMRMGEEEHEDLAMFVSDSLHVLTNESEIGRMGMLVSLEPNQMGSIRLNRRMIRGREAFDGQVMRTTLDRGDVRLFNDVYYVDVGFRGFYTQEVSDQMTVSWPAFFADFFGLTSLFLDVSVYTLIVAPLIMRARRRAVLARKLNGEKETGGPLAV